LHQPHHPDFCVSDDGLLSLSAGGAELLHTLDLKFRNAALALGSEEWHFPTIISAETLHRVEYLRSFPGRATRAEATGRKREYYLSPAVCYHFYELFMNSILPKTALVTCRQPCFRADPVDEHHLWEFTMREIVIIGEPDAVRRGRDEWKEMASKWAMALGIDIRLAVANDPFFGAETRGKKLVQRVKELKIELLTSGLLANDMPIASFNLHERFFTDRFNIGLETGQAHSGCVGFGLERWCMALMSQVGLREALRRVQTLS
jgi:seryl-tRNA synthetase